jgi:hypothetical protein
MEDGREAEKNDRKTNEPPSIGVKGGSWNDRPDRFNGKLV